MYKYGSNLFDFEEPADLAIFAYQCLPHSDSLQPDTFGSKEDLTPVHLIATRMNMTELQLSFDLFCTAACKGMEKETRFLRRQIYHKAETPQIDSSIYFVDRF